jgi:hypothetical protein
MTDWWKTRTAQPLYPDRTISEMWRLLQISQWDQI